MANYPRPRTQYLSNTGFESISRGLAQWGSVLARKEKEEETEDGLIALYGAQSDFFRYNEDLAGDPNMGSGEYQAAAEGGLSSLMDALNEEEYEAEAAKLEIFGLREISTRFAEKQKREQEVAVYKQGLEIDQILEAQEQIQRRNLTVIASSADGPAKASAFANMQQNRKDVVKFMKMLPPKVGEARMKEFDRRGNVFALTAIAEQRAKDGRMLEMLRDFRENRRSGLPGGWQPWDNVDPEEANDIMYSALKQELDFDKAEADVAEAARKAKEARENEAGLTLVGKYMRNEISYAEFKQETEYWGTQVKLDMDKWIKQHDTNLDVNIQTQLENSPDIQSIFDNTRTLIENLTDLDKLRTVRRSIEVGKLQLEIDEKRGDDLLDMVDAKIKDLQSGDADSIKAIEKAFEEEIHEVVVKSFKINAFVWTPGQSTPFLDPLNVEEDKQLLLQNQVDVAYAKMIPLIKEWAGERYDGNPLNVRRDLRKLRPYIMAELYFTIPLEGTQRAFNPLAMDELKDRMTRLSELGVDDKLGSYEFLKRFSPKSFNRYLIATSEGNVDIGETMANFRASTDTGRTRVDETGQTVSDVGGEASYRAILGISIGAWFTLMGLKPRSEVSILENRP